MAPAVFLINGVLEHAWLDAFLFAVAIAVGLTPEMLPMIVNANLARGAIALSRQKTIVKHLQAIQDSGAMDVWCTDKTGTLTQDKVVLIRHVDLRGSDSRRVLDHAYLNSLFQTGLKNLLNRAVIDRAESLGLRELAKTWWKRDEIPFDFGRRRQGTRAAGTRDAGWRFSQPVEPAGRSVVPPDPRNECGQDTWHGQKPQPSSLGQRAVQNACDQEGWDYTEIHTPGPPQVGDLEEDVEDRHGAFTRSDATIRKVAIGPSNNDTIHHARPLRPLDWARPALIRDSVNQPTAYWVGIATVSIAAITRETVDHRSQARHYSPVRILEDSLGSWLAGISLSLTLFPWACTRSDR